MCLQLGVSCCELKIAFGKKYDATTGLWHVGIAHENRGTLDVNVIPITTYIGGLPPYTHVGAVTTVVLDSPLSGTPGGTRLVVHGLRTDAEGNIYVMFTDDFASDTALYLARLDSTGALVWRTQISELLLSSEWGGFDESIWGMLAMRDDDSSVYGAVHYRPANPFIPRDAGPFEPVGGGDAFWGFRVRTSDGFVEQYFDDSRAGVTMYGSPDFCRWGAGKIWIGPDGTGTDPAPSFAPNASTGRRVYALDDAGSATVHDAGGGAAGGDPLYYRRVKDVAFNAAGDRWYAVQANDGADSADTTLMNLVEAFAVSGDAPAWKFTVADTNTGGWTHTGNFDASYAKLVRDPVTDILVGSVPNLRWWDGPYTGRFNLRDDGSTFSLLLNSPGGQRWIDLQPRRDRGGGSRGFVAAVAWVPVFAEYYQGADFVS